MKPRMITIALLLLAIVGLQSRLWVGEGSFAHVAGLSEKVELAQNANTAKKKRNDIIKAEIRELRADTASLEEKARSELGLIKEGETFYLVVDDSGS